MQFAMAARTAIAGLGDLPHLGHSPKTERRNRSYHFVLGNLKTATDNAIGAAARGTASVATAGALLGMNFLLHGGKPY